MEKRKLDVLQVGRGASALAVVAYHAWLSTRDFVGFPVGVIGRSLSEGYLGVDFFFVLSGFIILQVHERDARTATSARAYARKRLLRIYVPYLPIGGAMAIAYVLAPGLAGAAKGWSLFTSLTLVPDGGWPALSVAWTLQHELMFYAFFLFFYATRWFGWLVVAWGVFIAFAALAHLSFAAGVLGAIARTLVAPINLEFIFGMVACRIWRRVTPRAALSLTIIGVVWLLVYLGLHPQVTSRELFGLGVAVLVCGVVALERSGRVGAWAPLVALGNASYAIYLVHDPVISVAVRMTRAAELRWWAVLPVGIAASVLVGLIYHRFFEEPARRFLVRHVTSAFRIGAWRNQRQGRLATSHDGLVKVENGPQSE